MIKIGILDDEELIREGIKYKFPFSDNDFEIVYEGDDGNDLLKKLKSTTLVVDLFLVDIMMPKLKGIDFIKQAKELVKTATFIIISGFDDFPFVKEALKLGVSDYLLKPIDPLELKNVLLKEHDKISSARVKRQELIHDEISHHLSKKGNLSELSEQSSSYLKGLVQNETAIHVVLLGNLHSPQSFTNIRKKLEESLTDEQLLIWIYGIPQFFIYISKTNNINRLLDLIDYPTVTTVSITSIKNIENLTSYFTKAISLIPAFLTLGKKEVVPIETMESLVDINMVQKEKANHQQTSNLNKLMACDDKKIALNALYLILNETIPQNKKEYAFKHFMWKYYKSEVLLEWLQSFDLPELFYDQCLSLIDTLNEENNQLNGKDILDRVIKDLHQEYASKKSLKDYAENYYIHPNYLARLFKQELGVTFIETLTKIRMDKAKELLKNESLKINEVSQLIGYDDVRYFGQVFRKFYGLTPSQYKTEQKTLVEKS
ncbi:response regulator transcription factor [Bacillus sp. UNC438CL73TsuS30]|uniref:response regulator transcription factor n=1 Tax=Bacillus sp. UNC438CL73TsuS30 TaxID=1340434 RepID=UPI00047E487F|nr:helix-turn-helix domain-containing protein [Bacillus sp. UNC438CL73TsuS30]